MCFFLSSCSLSKFLSSIHARSGRGPCGCCCPNASTHNARFAITSSQWPFRTRTTTKTEASPSHHFHRRTTGTARSDFWQNSLSRCCATWTISIKGGPERRTRWGKLIWTQFDLKFSCFVSFCLQNFCCTHMNNKRTHKRTQRAIVSYLSFGIKTSTKFSIKYNFLTIHMSRIRAIWRCLFSVWTRNYGSMFTIH